jgi:hypothetical protein
VLEITVQVFSILTLNLKELKVSLPLYKMLKSFIHRAFCNLSNPLPAFFLLWTYTISLDLTPLYDTPLIYRQISLLAFNGVSQGIQTQGQHLISVKTDLISKFAAFSRAT